METLSEMIARHRAEVETVKKRHAEEIDRLRGLLRNPEWMAPSSK